MLAKFFRSFFWGLPLLVILFTSLLLLSPPDINVIAFMGALAFSELLNNPFVFLASLTPSIAIFVGVTTAIGYVLEKISSKVRHGKILILAACAVILLAMLFVVSMR